MSDIQYAYTVIGVGFSLAIAVYVIFFRMDE